MWTRIAPEPSELARPFWEGCNERRLRIQRCRTCGTFIHHPEPECTRCGGTDLTFDEVSGSGRIETFTVVHRSFVPGYQDVTPYVVGWIALPEQSSLRVFSEIMGDCVTSRVVIDAPVEVRFEEVEGFGAVPVFELTQQKWRTSLTSAETRDPDCRAVSRESADCSPMLDSSDMTVSPR